MPRDPKMPTYDIRWIPEDRVCEIAYEDMNVCDAASFTEWESTLFAGLEAAKKTAGGKFPLMVNIDGLTIGKAYADRYSTVAVRVAHDYATVITRYGRHAKTGSVVALTAMRRALGSDDPLARAKAYAANLFESRAQALAFIRTLQNEGLVART